MAFHATKKLLVAFIIFALVAPAFLLIKPVEARAQAGGILSCLTSLGTGVVSVGLAAAGSLIAVPTNPITIVPQTGIIAGATAKLELKDSCLDGIAFAIAKMVLRSMTRSIVNWINSGFQGDPLFLTDPSRYFADLAQQELNRVIYDIQRSATIYGTEIIISLVRPLRQGYNMGEVIAQNCIREQNRTALLDAGFDPDAFKNFTPTEDQIQNDDDKGYFWGPDSAYIPGDYATRLAQTQNKKTDTNESSGFFSGISKNFKKGLAAVGLAQRDDTEIQFTSRQTKSARQVCIDAGYSLSDCNTLSDTISGPQSCGTPGANPATCIPTGGLGNPENRPSVAAQANANRCPTTKAEQDARVRQCLSGSFSACGGWGGWYALSQNPENNILGATLAAQNRVAARRNAATAQANRELDRGQGLFSEKRCKPGTERYDTYDAESDYAGTATGKVIDCDYVIITPGTAIASTLKDVTGSSIRQAELADELGEALDVIISALVNQLINTGLRSLTDQGGVLSNTAADIGSNVYNVLRNEADFKSGVTGEFTSLTRTVERYAVVRRETIATGEGVVSALKQINSSIISSGGANACPQTQSEMSGDIARIGELEATLGQYRQELAALDTDYAKLREISAQTAQVSTAELSNLMSAYNQIAYRLPNNYHVAQAEQELAQTRATLARIQGKLGACQAEKAAQQTQSSGGF